MIIKNKLQLTVISVLTLTLFACGGGGSDSPEPDTPKAPVNNTPVTKSYAGKVIDGYVSGATIWLDLNGDGQFNDQNEPFAISTDAGNYALELTSEQQECLPYTTTYVDVPVGAIDEDSGEVTEAYQMSFPPSIDPISDDEIRNISPLTSVLWETLQKQLEDEGNSAISCEKLKNDANLREVIKNGVDSAISNIVGFYNISAEQIYADFIANNDSEAYDLAQNIVKSLKASYAYLLELQNQYPTATDIRVIVFQNIENSNNPDQWQRYITVSHPTEYFTESVILTPDLTAIEQVLGYRFYSEGSWNTGVLGLTTTISYRDDEQLWECFNEEQIRFTYQGVDLDLINATPPSRESTYEDCQSLVYGNGRERGYGYTFENGDFGYGAVFSVANDDAEYTALSDWHNIKDKEAELQLTDLGDYLLAIPYQFDDDISLDVNRWQKTKTYTDENGNGVDINKFGEKGSDAVHWEKTTSFSDDTHTWECSSDGESWSPCEG